MLIKMSLDDRKDICEHVLQFSFLLHRFVKDLEAIEIENEPKTTLG